MEPGQLGCPLHTEVTGSRAQGMRQDHRAYWWFGIFLSFVKRWEGNGYRNPGLWGRHAGCPSRQVLGDGYKSPGVSYDPFLCRERQCWLAKGWGERQSTGGRGCGQGAQGSPNMQSPAAPKTRLPFEK